MFDSYVDLCLYFDLYQLIKIIGQIHVKYVTFKNFPALFAKYVDVV